MPVECVTAAAHLSLLAVGIEMERINHRALSLSRKEKYKETQVTFGWPVERRGQVIQIASEKNKKTSRKSN